MDIKSRSKKATFSNAASHPIVSDNVCESSSSCIKQNHDRTLSSCKLDMLIDAAQPTTTQSPNEQFNLIVDEKPITAVDWQEVMSRITLASLTQQHPSFNDIDFYNIETQACLNLTYQPGPIFVPTAHSKNSMFHLQLLSHPLMPLNALKTWKVGPLNITLLPLHNNIHDRFDDMVVHDNHPNLKKRLRSSKHSSVFVTDFSSSRKTSQNQTHFYRQYPFHTLDIKITDMSFPASGCLPMKLEFSVEVMDPLSRKTTFKVHSNPFVVISNCNQWTQGFAVCLKNFIFPNNSNQASFCRFFNFLQLGYLDSKGFSERRFLEPNEIRLWIKDTLDLIETFDFKRGKRDRVLFETHDIVSEDLFDYWFEKAGSVFYDLHTSNVGKLFQTLWAKGFIGIGSFVQTDNNEVSSNISESSHHDYHPGRCRLYVDTKTIDERPAHESYLILETPDVSYQLLSFERDHLAYFFEHSKNAMGCTHLVSVTNVGNTLPIETIFTPRNNTTSGGKSTTISR